MKLDDEVYDECIEKIRKTMNFYGYQNREMADDILSDVSMPISRPLQETIRTQQATIERLTEQRDRLLKSGNMVLRGHSSFDTSYMAYCIRDLQSLIAEIESSK